MNIIIIVVAVTAGVILGGTAIYVYQGKCRQKELKLLAECMEKILREEKIRETKAGEETLYARLESRLVRIQEMLNGRTEAAEKSKDEIQKLISEIAHQMRTPLANIRTYQELLEEEWSKTGTKTDENVDNYLNAMRSGEQQALQIRIEHEFYCDLWKEEQGFFFECFIQKHRIFTEDNEEKTGKNRKMTREELTRMGAAMGAMQDKSWTQRIEG